MKVTFKIIRTDYHADDNCVETIEQYIPGLLQAYELVDAHLTFDAKRGRTGQYSYNIVEVETV